MMTSLVPILALVPFNGAEESNSSTLPMSQFSRFLRAVREHTQAPMTTGLVGVSQHPVPVDRIIMSGTWAIARALGKSLQAPPGSEADALDLLARTNRLLSAGMLLVHGSAEAAAEAFWRDVIEVVNRAHSLGYRPGMQLPASAWRCLLQHDTRKFTQALPSIPPEPTGFVDTHWRAPASLFFASLYQAARSHGKHLRELTNRLASANSPYSDNGASELLRDGGDGTDPGELLAAENLFRGYFLCGDVDHFLRDLEERCRYLDPTFSLAPKVDEKQGRVDHAKHHALNAEAFLALAPRAESFLVRCQLLSRIRVLPTTWPATARINVDDTWLDSLILLAATDAPADTDSLPSVRAYIAALETVGAMDLDELHASVWSRLRDRIDGPLSDEDEHSLLELLDERLAEVILMRPPATVQELSPTDPSALISRVLVHLRDSDVFMDARTAFEVAVNRDPVALTGMRNEIAANGCDFGLWLKSVAFSITWATLEPNQLLAIVRGGVLNPADIMDGMDAVTDPSITNIVIPELMTRNEDDHALINLAMRKGFQPFTDRQLRALVPHLDADNLEVIADRMVDDYLEGTERRWSLTLHVLSRCSTEYLHRKMRNHVWRIQLAMAMPNILHLTEEKWSTYDALRTQFGPDAYQHLVLCAVAWVRWRDDQNTSEEAFDLAPWELTFASKGTPHLNPRLMGKGFTSSDGVTLCLKIPEGVALAWASNKDD